MIDQLDFSKQDSGYSNTSNEAKKKNYSAKKKGEEDTVQGESNAGTRGDGRKGRNNNGKGKYEKKKEGYGGQ